MSLVYSPEFKTPSPFVGLDYSKIEDQMIKAMGIPAKYIYGTDTVDMKCGGKVPRAFRSLLRTFSDKKSGRKRLLEEVVKTVYNRRDDSYEEFAKPGPVYTTAARKAAVTDLVRQQSQINQLVAQQQETFRHKLDKFIIDSLNER